MKGMKFGGHDAQFGSCLRSRFFRVESIWARSERRRTEKARISRREWQEKASKPTHACRRKVFFGPPLFQLVNHERVEGGILGLSIECGWEKREERKGSTEDIPAERRRFFHTLHVILSSIHRF